MIAWLLIAGALAAEPQPRGASVQVCTPISFDIKTVKVACSEGYELRLWGVRASSSSRLLRRPPDQLAAIFNAQSGRWRPGSVIGLDGAMPMRCSAKASPGSAFRCFVKSPLVFGDEDLACRLVQSGFALPARSALGLSGCSKYKPA
jgi:hypothetical protein